LTKKYGKKLYQSNLALEREIEVYGEAIEKMKALVIK
jgi:hypothetical protein